MRWRYTGSCSESLEGPGNKKPSESDLRVRHLCEVNTQSVSLLFIYLFTYRYSYFTYGLVPACTYLTFVHLVGNN